jgi:hypothetical protein
VIAKARMACSVDLVKLKSVPPFRVDATKEYTIKANQSETVVTASSAFEAASKFAFCAKESGCLDSTAADTVHVVDTVSQDIRALEGDENPQVELNYVEKKWEPSLQDFTTEFVSDVGSIVGLLVELCPCQMKDNLKELCSTKLTQL